VPAKEQREVRVVTNRKPHSGFAGYVSERRNRYSGGHTIILDCKLAEEQDLPLVEDYQAEGGRYQVLCNDHGTILHTTIRQVAYAAMLMRLAEYGEVEVLDKIPADAEEHRIAVLKRKGWML